MRPFPQHGKCFVCGSDNPHSIGVRWFIQDDQSLYGEVTLDDHQQGPPGLSHGGATAAILDEAMGLTVWLAGLQVACVNLNIDYRKPVPLGQPITITGRVVEVADRNNKAGKLVHAESEICLPDGEVAVSGRGVYVEAKHLFENGELFKKHAKEQP